MAVLAPMPKANANTVTAVKPGCFSNWRKAKRRSFMICDFRFAICDSREGQSLAHHQRHFEFRIGGMPSQQEGHHPSSNRKSKIENRKFHHSYRSASIGSTLAARRAGNQHASKATAVRLTVTNRKIT